MKKSEHDIHASYALENGRSKKRIEKVLKLNSYFIHIGNPEKIIAVSKVDYKKFNDAKDMKRYGKVCIELVQKYSTVSPNDLWVIPK